MVEIRRASIEDVAVVQQIVRDAYTPYIARIGREPRPLHADYCALIDEQRVWIADGVGIVVLLPQEDAMLLENVAVSPTVRGTGVGRALLAFTEEHARAEGYRAVELYTNVRMTENIALYTRIGYVETHRTDERVFMRKSI